MTNRQTNIIEGTAEALKKFKATTFELITRGKSSFVKDGTGGDSGVPAQYLSTNKNLMIEPVSRLFLGQGKGFRATQYVIGAGTIYTEDYYETTNGDLVLENVSVEEAKKRGYQLRPGLKSQNYDLKAEYERSMQKGICFEFGKLDVSKYGDDPMLLRFIMEHEMNVEAPRAKENKDPRRLNLFMFRPSIPEREAAQSNTVINIDAEAEALAFVAKLRTETARGFEYNEPKMDAVLAILDDGHGLRGGDVHQKFAIIAKAAKKAGAEFIEVVKQTLNQYRMQIGIADSLKVLTIGASEVKCLNDTQNATIYSFENKEMSKENAIEELMIYFLSSEKGQADFSLMNREVEKAKIKSQKN